MDANIVPEVSNFLGQSLLVTLLFYGLIAIALYFIIKTAVKKGIKESKDKI